jgi:hypothetical protein
MTKKILFHDHDQNLDYEFSLDKHLPSDQVNRKEYIALLLCAVQQ